MGVRASYSQGDPHPEVVATFKFTRRIFWLVVVQVILGIFTLLVVAYSLAHQILSS